MQEMTTRHDTSSSNELKRCLTALFRSGYRVGEHRAEVRNDELRPNRENRYATNAEIDIDGYYLIDQITQRIVDLFNNKGE